MGAAPIYGERPCDLNKRGTKSGKNMKDGEKEIEGERQTRGGCASAAILTKVTECGARLVGRGGEHRKDGGIGVVKCHRVDHHEARKIIPGVGRGVRVSERVSGRSGGWASE